MKENVLIFGIGIVNVWNICNQYVFWGVVYEFTLIIGMPFVFEVYSWQICGLIIVGSWMKISWSLLEFLLTRNTCLLC
jgi:hypothetical protein